MMVSRFERAGGAGRRQECDMRWRDARRSDNVEDLRGRRMGGGMRVGGLGLGGMLVLLVLTYLVGGDPLALLTQGAPGAGVPEAGPADPPPGPPQDEAGQFMQAVLASTRTSGAPSSPSSSGGGTTARR
jgi:predicted metalloprotease